MGGGPRPWLGTPIKMKVVATTNNWITLESAEEIPPTMKAGDEYLVVFNPYTGDAGGDSQDKQDG